MSVVEIREPAGLGRFGEFGGRYVPESLVAGVRGPRAGVPRGLGRPGVPRRSSTGCWRSTPAGRPPLTPAWRLSAELGITLLLKREDLTHTGSHKINNVLGQALLARRMGKTRLIAETGAGQHGVATATAAALLGLRGHRLHGRARHRAAGSSTCSGCGCWAPRSCR